MEPRLGAHPKKARNERYTQHSSIEEGIKSKGEKANLEDWQ